MVNGLLKEYSHRSTHFKIKTIDYARFPGAAEGFLAKYKQLGTLKDKDFVLFESEGKTKVVFANQLSDYDLSKLLSGETNSVPRTAFKGEMLFSAALFSVTHARPFKAYFLIGHGEHDSENTSQDPGYGKFAALLRDENNVQCETLSLKSTNDISPDSLLIIAGPAKSPLLSAEKEKVETFLKQGGRLLLLENNLLRGGNSGVSEILATWGVKILDNVISEDGEFVAGPNSLLTATLNADHAITKPLQADGLQVLLVAPRAVGKGSDASKSADAPKIDWLAMTSRKAIGQYVAADGSSKQQQTSFPLMVALEQGGIKGVNADRGNTRVVVIGDSLCFDNQLLDLAANHYFANAVVNWLTARPTILLQNLGPRPIRQYQVIITPHQMKFVQWILLAGMPAAVLLFGGLVWLRRRS
jgi:hypothetical protein